MYLRKGNYAAMFSKLSYPTFISDFKIDTRFSSPHGSVKGIDTLFRCPSILMLASSSVECVPAGAGYRPQCLIRVIITSPLGVLSAAP